MYYACIMYVSVHGWSRIMHTPTPVLFLPPFLPSQKHAALVEEEKSLFTSPPTSPAPATATRHHCLSVRCMGVVGVLFLPLRRERRTGI